MENADDEKGRRPKFTCGSLQQEWLNIFFEGILLR